MQAAAAAAASVGCAIFGTWTGLNYWKETHPLVRSERVAWQNDHALGIDQGLKTELLPLLAHFPLGSFVALGYVQLNADGFEYQHWFITNDTWHLEWGNGAGFTNHTVTVHAIPKPQYFRKALVPRRRRDARTHGPSCRGNLLLSLSPQLRACCQLRGFGPVAKHADTPVWTSCQAPP